MKIALLSRVSTSKQDNQNQILALTEFAAKQGWEIVAQFVDTVSGSGKKARVQFEKMMQAASRHEFDLVLFWKLDRFSREGTRKTLQYLQQLDDWKVGWRSFQEPYFDSCGAFRDVVISIASTLAAQERITISERTKAGLQRAIRDGRTLGRRPTKVNVDRALELQAEGLGLRSIAAKLGVAVNTLQKNLQPARELQA
jgi:DNA invertase Pin-like site-specific DNA recombinase